LTRQGLPVARSQGPDLLAPGIDEDALQAKGDAPDRPEALADETGGGGSDNPGLLETELCGHGALHRLQQRGVGRLLRPEGLVGVENLDAVGSADELVVAGLVGVLGPAPAADVADQNGLEVGADLHVFDEALEGVAALDALP
jgi:hypothetical protein